MIGPEVCWRCFPFDFAAGDGQPFSCSYIRPGQTAGRFDLHDRPPVLYLGDHAPHVIAESLQGYRNQAFLAGMLRKHGRPLAVVEVMLNEALRSRVADLCDPATLVRLDLKPDDLAHHDRTVTQPIAQRVYEADFAGIRWWSTITGAWHTVALFSDRLADGGVSYGAPRLLAPGDPDVAEARHMLNIAPLS